MIKYPRLEKDATIGVTAPSSGVPEGLHEIFKQSCERLKSKGFHIICGDTVWTQEKAKSASTEKRADEFNEMMSADHINIIIPPWGGELLI
ncbi:LD-carboxypeptidase, partial [Lysinibacillus sphaericus]|uniref:LD-carboxypeptidase n=1 Tax=Lysinibacillus sphaericus TaxID=1421 RepID=UPI00215622DA